MTDLVAVMSKLVNPDGKILVPGIYEQVRALSRKCIYYMITRQMINMA